jgi:hypothetical protein
MYFGPRRKGCTQAIFLEIIACVPVSPPVPVTYRGASFPKVAAFELTGECIAHALDSGAAGGFLVRDVLAEWRVRFGAQIQNLPAGEVPNSVLQMPTHIASLASAGLWSYLTITPTMKFDASCSLSLLRQHLQTFFKLDTPHAELERITTEHVLEVGLDGGMFRWAADSVCSWAPDIIAAGGDDESRDHRRMHVEQIVAWLRQADWSANESELVNSRLVVGEFGNWNHQLQKFTSYRIGFLLECLVLSFGIRSASDLQVVLGHAVQLLPPAWRSSLAALMKADATLPSAATMTRARLYVDVAYMLLKRKQFETLLESRPVFFGLIDSSPQGGRNWEIFELYGSLM